MHLMIAPDGLFVAGWNPLAASARALLTGLGSRWGSIGTHALGGAIRPLLRMLLLLLLLVPAVDVVVRDMPVLAAVPREGFVIVARLRVGGDDVPRVQQAGNITQ